MWMEEDATTVDEFGNYDEKFEVSLEDLINEGDGGEIPVLSEEEDKMEDRVTRFLINGAMFGPDKAYLVITVYASVCSFMSYMLVYGFRKPWTSAQWGAQETLFGFTEPKLFLDWSQMV
tara:strand:+ start:191 stop:547 length:357 start_codon:yes stop_codon:yes gene_type:complete